MASRFEELQTEIESLVQQGQILLEDLADEDLSLQPQKYAGKFRGQYQSWYSESMSTVRQLLPDRFEDFRNLYNSGTRKKLEFVNLSISDYLMGNLLPGPAGQKNAKTAAGIRLQQQIAILESVLGRLKSKLADIEQLVLADVLDSELEESRLLNKNGFIRAAGAVAGVALEKHLKQVCKNHEIIVRKKKPTISDLNDLLKKEEVLDTPNWRFNQRLGDLRNLSDHDGERDPTSDEINELIDGADKVMKTLF